MVVIRRPTDRRAGGLGWLITAGLLSLGMPAVAADGPMTEEQALAISQAAIGRAVGDFELRDTDGRPVRLSDFRGKPLVVSLVYTSCAYSCPVTTQTIAEAVGAAWDALDEDSFTVITVGFDAGADTPERMRAFARKHAINDDRWQFLSGDLQQVAGLTDDVGFVFYPSSKGFDHLDQTTVLDAEGKVYRQVYGAGFETPKLVDPLKELVFGTTSPFASVDDLVKKVRLFCTIYDPAGDRYRFDYGIFVRLIVGAGIVLTIGWFVVRNWWRILRGGDRRRKSAASPPIG